MGQSPLLAAFGPILGIAKVQLKPYFILRGGNRSLKRGFEAALSQHKQNQNSLHAALINTISSPTKLLLRTQFPESHFSLPILRTPFLIVFSVWRPPSRPHPQLPAPASCLSSTEKSGLEAPERVLLGRKLPGRGGGGAKGKKTLLFQGLRPQFVIFATDMLVKSNVLRSRRPATE